MTGVRSGTFCEPFFGACPKASERVTSSAIEERSRVRNTSPIGPTLSDNASTKFVPRFWRCGQFRCNLESRLPELPNCGPAWSIIPWRSEANCFESVADCVDYDFWRVSQNRRSPTADIIDVFISIHIPDSRPFPAIDEKRFAVYVAKCAHRRVYAAGNAFLCASKQFGRTTHWNSGVMEY